MVILSPDGFTGYKVATSGYFSLTDGLTARPRAIIRSNGPLTASGAHSQHNFTEGG